jgi:dipeptidyl aminopeptidase/acylaminoacyl peptidase
MIHGDKDELVPIKHSQEFLAAMEAKKAPVKLVTIEGAAHGFNQKQNETVRSEMLAWFEKYLAK